MISRAQTKTGSGSAPTVAVTWDGNTVTGNTIVVAVGTVGSATTVSSITDSQTNSYSKIHSDLNSVVGELWYATNITGGTTPTVTITLSSILGVAVVMREYSGLTSSPLDVNTKNLTTGASSPTGTTTVTAQPNELVVVWNASSATTPTVDNRFSNLATSSPANIKLGLADRIANAIDRMEAIFTVGAADNSVAGVATFKDTVVGNELKVNFIRPRAFAPGLAR